MTIKIKPYTSEIEDSWNLFVRENRFHFMFLRSYMEYHSDRFTDHSWVIFDDDELVGIVPANQEKNSSVSHRGLTFGGFLFSQRLSSSRRIFCVEQMIAFFRSIDFQKLIIKTPPSIYPDFDPILNFALWKESAYVNEQQVTLATKKSFVDQWSSRRKRGLKKARKNSVVVRSTEDFEPFWHEVLIPVLKAHHNTVPTHSLSEIQSLASDHPEILQIEALHHNKIIAGMTLYRTEKVIHAQYIASNEVGRNVGALEAIVHFCLMELVAENQWFNFGSVNENGGRVVNSGLLNWKEEFAAIPFLHTTYELHLSESRGQELI